MPSVERLAIDLYKWSSKSPTYIREDAASFFIESGKRFLERRVNPVVIRVADFGKLVKDNVSSPEDEATWRVYQWAKKAEPTAKIWTHSSNPNTEEILDNFLPFSDFNPGRAIIWISPPLEGVYKESRIAIYQTIEVNNEKYLFFRAICEDQNKAECLGSAKKLFSFTDPKEDLTQVLDAEQLRSTPLPLLIPPTETFSSFFEKIFDMPEVWKSIARGEDIEEKKRALRVVGGIIQENYSKIVGAKSDLQRQLLGVAIEQEIIRRTGYSLQSGACGMLYSDLFSRSILTSFGLRSSQIEGRAKFIHNCGVCGKALNRHMCKGDHCPYCGGVYEGC